MGETLTRIGDRTDGGTVTAPAAMLLSYDSRFAWQNQPHNPHLDYPAVFAGLYRALWKRNIGVNIVPPEADLSAYRLVVAPLLYVLDEPLAARLTQYVEAGGTLLLTCRTGVMDMDNMIVNERLPGLLRELCGIVVDEYDSLEDGRRVPVTGTGDLEGASGNAYAWADVVSLQDAASLMCYAGEYYADTPAVTVNARGQGRVVYLGTVLEEPALDTLIGHVCTGAGVAAPVASEPGLEITERVSAKGRFLFLLNPTAEPRWADVGAGGHDLVTDEPVSGRVTVPPLGVRIVQTAAPAA
jgi:beta-galactosidase